MAVNLTMKTTVFFLLLFSLPLLSQTNGSFPHDGSTRTFVYYTPSTWTEQQQLPLMIVLHGLTQTGGGVMDITQFNDLAEQHGFVVVYPDGENFAWNANMNVTVSTADDLGFIESLATYFQNNLGTDPARQYLVGFSNGGFMSHKIACESSMCFAAIATVAGNMSDTTFADCAPQFTPSILHIHGTADAVVPYNGGVGTGVSVDQVMEKWRSFLNCNPDPVSINMPNQNMFDLSSPQRITWQNCLNDLELIKITGGGHQWPGIQTLVGGVGTINFDFYSPEVIWEFLSGKACPSSGLVEDENMVLTYPNPVLEIIHLPGSSEWYCELTNVRGEIVLKGNYIHSIPLAMYPPGIYFLKLSRSDQEAILKILKQ